MEQQYYNLVFINHSYKERNFLFQLPLPMKLKSGEKVFVETIQGECMGTCVSDSFIVGEHETACIMAGTGAYLPLRDVIGWATQREGYECISFASASLPF